MCLKLFYHILELYSEYFKFYFFSQKSRQFFVVWIIYWRINYQWGLIIVFYPCSEIFHTLPSDHCPAGNCIHFCRILVAKPEFCKVHASLVHLLSFYSYVRIFAGNILHISYFLRRAVVCEILFCSGCCQAQWWPSTPIHANKVYGTETQGG